MRVFTVTLLSTLAFADFGDNIYNNSRPPVEFVSIAETDQNDFQYNLSGNYGTKTLLGSELVYLNFLVDGANIANGDYVVTWASFPDPSTPGLIQGLMCRVKYYAEEVDLIEKDVMVNTYDDYTGSIDFTTVQGHPNDWYLDSKQSIAVWEVDMTDAHIDYASTYYEVTRDSS